MEGVEAMNKEGTNDCDEETSDGEEEASDDEEEMKGRRMTTTRRREPTGATRLKRKSRS
jgi:hypothetical protein